MKRSKYLLAGMIIMAVMFTSCAQKMNFSRSAIVPGATGYAKIKKDNNGNNSVKVKLYNLASPDQLTPPRLAYVVWMMINDNQNKNIGRITSERGISRTKKATLETVTVSKPTGFFITAEDIADPVTPGTTVVLTTK